MAPRTLVFIVLLALASASAAAEIQGRVATAAGTPVEHARVQVSGADTRTFTDMHGRFTLVGVEPPAELIVTHARFQTQRVAVDGGEPIEVVLQVKQEVYEEIVVSANRGEENFSPVSVASSVVDPADAVAPPATLAELVSATVGVSENGQGGIFQTYSVRGIARQRILTLVSGMRVVGERRAGVSVSFIDPLLMGRVDVLRGPSSTYYGSGALGGVVQLFPRLFDGPTAAAGYDSRGDELHLAAGWGDDRWSLGVAHRDAGDAETPGGERISSHFTQTSASLRRTWDFDGYRLELTGLLSAGYDIGKANTEFPARVTEYPQEHHLLARVALRSDDDWDLEVWVHPNDLETRVTGRGPVRNTVENEAFDFGLNWQKTGLEAGGFLGRVGVDYFGRRDVDAHERELELTAGGSVPIAEARTLDGGSEDEVGLYGALERNWGRAVVLAGGRLSWIRQENGAEPSIDDSGVTGFAGIVLPVADGLELVANVGSGLRFPSLSERFFSGTTGRGEVVGTAGLDAERSLNLDAGLRWYGDRLFVAGYLFRNSIDDYIERIEIAPDVLTFRNLVSGTIEGVELEGFYRLGRRWTLSAGAQTLQGRDDDGGPLGDIPADRSWLGGRWQGEHWSWEGRWEARAEKTDAGSGEQAIPSAQLVSMSFRVALRDGLWLKAGARNLLDEEYFNSADRRVTLSPGRSFALGLEWRG